MKLGLISDVHGDPLGLELAWAQLTLLGVDRIVCAGDVVGYGALPDRAVAFLIAHQIPVVRGNHDRWALERGPGMADPYGGGTPSDETLAYLETLPFSLEIEVEGKIGVVVHGSPRDDMEFVSLRECPPRLLRGWLEQMNADFLVVGHTHQPMWFRCDRGLVVNPGSIISAPVVSTSRSFAVLDVATLDVQFHAVETGEPLDVAPWPDTVG